jgi:hypothetical protein
MLAAGGISATVRNRAVTRGEKGGGFQGRLTSWTKIGDLRFAPAPGACAVIPSCLASSEIKEHQKDMKRQITTYLPLLLMLV